MSHFASFIDQLELWPMRRSMVMKLPHFSGWYASSPLFQRVTEMTASWAPFLMNSFWVLALLVADALTPRTCWIACSTALLPLPFWPDTKLMWGLHARQDRMSGLDHSRKW